jgi:trehalose 6-phosphate phosphatase
MTTSSEPASDREPTIRAADVDAVVFDMDGVVTDTAVVHAAAWKRLFDEYLTERSRRTGEPWEPFDAELDYVRFVDGKPRYDGVRSFLRSRGITLPEGNPSDPPDGATVVGLGDRKDAYFHEQLRRGGARAFPTTVELVGRLADAGIPVGIISSSRNMADVLRAAGVYELFPVKVDGVEAEALHLPGKPDPAVFIEAAHRLGADPPRTAVVEDSLAGIEAGHRGGFGLTIGVDRTGQRDALLEAGADLVVTDLGEIVVVDGRAADGGGTRIRDLPPALESSASIAELLRGRRPAVFLDYDGTMTPIVERPEDALLAHDTRRALERLGAVCPVAVVSGRDLDDVRAMVGVPGIWYAGSHGFDILGPNGERHQMAIASLPALDAAERQLRAAVAEIPGARVERKRFAVAVHHRQVPADRVPDVASAVGRVAAEHPGLHRTGGKRVIELRPAVPWDKGKALRFVLETLGLDGPDVAPVYVGDDETDEDAFRAIADRGLTFVVRGEDDERLTAAHYSLAATGQVRDLLEALTDLARSAG